MPQIARKGTAMKPTNEERADRARAAYYAWREANGSEEDPNFLYDLACMLADMRHLAAEEKGGTKAFESAITMSETHFYDERSGNDY